MIGSRFQGRGTCGSTTSISSRQEQQELYWNSVALAAAGGM